MDVALSTAGLMIGALLTWMATAGIVALPALCGVVFLMVGAAGLLVSGLATLARPRPAYARPRRR